jgi:hypothetical protein
MLQQFNLRSAAEERKSIYSVRERAPLSAIQNAVTWKRGGRGRCGMEYFYRGRGVVWVRIEKIKGGKT